MTKLRRRRRRKNTNKPHTFHLPRILREVGFKGFDDSAAHYRDVCDWFMKASPRSVNAAFMTLPGAFRIDCKEDTPAVFIPGHRSDSVLLIAHTDTVWTDDVSTRPDKDIICWDGFEAYSSSPTEGIGADDRAGCAALWLLRDTGHSLLLVPYEESGCIGSSYIASDLSVTKTKAILGCRFMLQFDRHGSHNIVTYGCQNPSFVRHLKGYLPRYEWVSGSFSDVAVLAPAVDVACANLSIGYRDEHTGMETLDILDFMRTVIHTGMMLKHDCPAFEYCSPVVKRKTVLPPREDYDLMIEDEWRESLLNSSKQRFFMCMECCNVFAEDEVPDESCPQCLSRELVPYETKESAQ